MKKTFIYYSILGCFATGAATASPLYINFDGACPDNTLCRVLPNAGQCCAANKTVSKINLPTGSNGWSLSIGTRTIQIFDADGYPTISSLSDTQKMIINNAIAGGATLSGAVIPASETLYNVTFDMVGGTLPNGVSQKTEAIAAGTTITASGVSRPDGAIFRGFGTSLATANKVVTINSNQTLTAQYECPADKTMVQGTCFGQDDIVVTSSGETSAITNGQGCWRMIGGERKNFCKWKGSVHLHPKPYQSSSSLSSPVLTYNYASGSSVNSVYPEWTDTLTNAWTQNGTSDKTIDLWCHGAGCWMENLGYNETYLGNGSLCNRAVHVEVPDINSCYETIQVVADDYYMSDSGWMHYVEDEYIDGELVTGWVPVSEPEYDDQQVLKPGYYLHSDGTCYKATTVTQYCNCIDTNNQSVSNVTYSDGTVASCESCIDAGNLISGCNVIATNIIGGTQGTTTTPFVYTIPQLKAEGYTFRGYYRQNSDVDWVANVDTTAGGPVMGFVVTNPNAKGLSVGGRAIIEMSETEVTDLNSEYDMHLYSAWAKNCSTSWYPPASSPNDYARCLLHTGTSWVGLTDSYGCGPGDVKYLTLCNDGYTLSNGGTNHPTCTVESGPINIVYEFKDQYGHALSPDIQKTCTKPQSYSMLAATSFNEAYNGAANYYGYDHDANTNTDENGSYALRYYKTHKGYYRPGYNVTCSTSEFGTPDQTNQTVIVTGYVCVKSDCDDPNGINYASGQSSCEDISESTSITYNGNITANGVWAAVYGYNALPGCQRLKCRGNYQAVMNNSTGMMTCQQDSR